MKINSNLAKARARRTTTRTRIIKTEIALADYRADLEAAEALVRELEARELAGVAA